MNVVALIAFFLVPSQAASTSKSSNGLGFKNIATLHLGMTRASVEKALEPMGAGALELDETDACKPSAGVHLSSSAVYAQGRFRFDRKGGEKCDFVLRKDSLFDMDFDFKEGLQGDVVLGEHLKALGKPYKQDSSSATGVSYYFWKRGPSEVMLVINDRKGEALRKEVRDLSVDRQAEKILRDEEYRAKAETRKKIQNGL